MAKCSKSEIRILQRRTSIETETNSNERNPNDQNISTVRLKSELSCRGFSFEVQEFYLVFINGLLNFFVKYFGHSDFKIVSDFDFRILRQNASFGDIGKLPRKTPKYR